MASPNKTQYAILGVLAIQPMSGYEIKKSLDASVSNFWNENFGHIYPVLLSLKKRKLVIAPPLPDQPRKKQVYQITDAGRRHLHLWLQSDPVPSPPRNELLLQLFFARGLDASLLLKKIAGERARQERRRAALSEIAQRLSTGGDREALIWFLTARYGLAMTDASLRWCDEAEEVLATSDPSQRSPGG